ncbi:zf-CCHC domain-containing protein [Tanacetum coccineum]
MGSHTLKQLKSYSFDEIKNLFKTTMRRVHTFIPMESESERVIPELTAGSPKRLKTGESSVPVEEPKYKEEEEPSQERIHQMMIIVLEQGINVEALQIKYPIIDWEICTKGARKVDIYMLVEREYPLSRGVLTQMLVAKLLVEQDNKISRELLRKIFMQVFILSTTKPRFCTAQVTTASTNQLVLLEKFLRALHPKWRAKVTAIEDSKDLTSLSLDELIGNLKVHEMIIKKDSEIVKAKGERKSLALKAKKESSDEECSTFGSEDEDCAMAVRDFKNDKSDRKCFRCGDPNHLTGECPNPPKHKNQRAFVRGSWSDSGKGDDVKASDETCLVTQASSEVCSESS